MAAEITKCPLCSWDAKVQHAGDAEHLNCERCEEFRVTRSLLAKTFSDKESEEAKTLLLYLSAHTRQPSERGEVVTLDTSNWRELALAHKSTPLSIKITKLLELVASRSTPGQSVKLDAPTDAPLVDAVSKTEMQFLLRHLVENGHLRQTDQEYYFIEVKGWEQLQPVAGIPGKCFVAMSFHDDLKDAYDKGIYLAVKEDCKMNPREN